MFTKKNSILGLALIGLLFLNQACTKNATVYNDNTAEITTPVSLSKDLVPILSTKCSISGCHNSGGHIPDLTADKVYNALNTGSYLDLGTPEKSSLYLWITGKKPTAMPVGGPANPSNLSALTIAWIKQGAKNN